MTSCAAALEQPSVVAGGPFVIKRTFIELVDESLTLSGLPRETPLRLRSYSAPTLDDNSLSDGEEVTGCNSLCVRTACKGEPEFGDLSDSDLDVKSSVARTQQDSDSTRSEPNTRDSETASQTNESICTSSSCEDLSKLCESKATDNQGSQFAEVCGRERSPMDLAALLRENARLALENQLLKENARLVAERKSLQADTVLEPSSAELIAPQSWTESASKVSPDSPQGQPVVKPSAPPGIWFLPSACEMYGEQPYVNEYPMQMYHACVDQAACFQASKVKSCPRRRCKQLATGAGGSDCEPPTDGDCRTTVMLRNLPNNYNREMVMAMLDAEGFAGLYDFLYLPIDFKTEACLGYAFVNLVTPSGVPRFWDTFTGYKKWAFTSKKVCCVTWSGPHQGRDAHVDRYRNSPIMHSSVPEEYKPIVLEGGERIQFPAPTKTPKLPRTRGFDAHAGASG